MCNWLDRNLRRNYNRNKKEGLGFWNFELMLYRVSGLGP